MKYTVPCQMQYCVYTHSHNGAVFYVGHGIPQRPFDMVRRNQAWKDYVTKLHRYEVDIVLWTNDAKEAKRLESKLILELCPACNVRLNPTSLSQPEPPRKRFVYLPARIPPDMWEKLKTIAAREKMSMNSFIGTMLCMTLDLSKTDDGMTMLRPLLRKWRTLEYFTQSYRVRSAHRKVKAVPMGE